MSKKEETKIVISVDRKSYDLAQENYLKKLKKEDQILKEIYKLLPDAKINEKTLFTDVLSYFYKLVELVYKKENTLKLKGAKLTYLLELDVSSLIIFTKEYDQLKHLKEPNIDNFSSFIDSEEERERYILAKKVANICNETKDKHRIYGKEIVLGFNHLVQFDLGSQNYSVNVRYIKNLRL